MGSLLAFEIKKIEDYKEMCVAKGLPFDEEVFEEYLSIVRQDATDKVYLGKKELQDGRTTKGGLHGNVCIYKNTL